MKKLLNKTLRVYLLFGSFILIFSIPLYYIIIEEIWTEELDEHNRIVAATIKHNLKSLDLSKEEFSNSLAFWNALQPGITMEAVPSLKNDTVINFYRHTKAFPYKTKQDRFQSLSTYFEYKGDYYRLVSEVNMEESQDTVLALTLIKLISLVLLISSLVLLNRFNAKRIWKPFYDTLDKLQRFDIDKNERIDLTPTDILEFHELNKQIEALIDRSRKAYIMQKEFTENASHELQTPLAILQSKLDLFIQINHLSHPQKLIINDTQHALNRLIFLSKNLLLLSRIENSHFPEMKRVEIDKVIDELLLETEDMIELKQISIKHRIKESTFVRANYYLFGILIKNLWLNAIKHSKEGGEVTITSDENELILTNEGTEGLNPEFLYRRFASYSKNPSSSGLGLAIVKEIANQHNWKIAYYFNNNRHHFKVSF